MVDSAPWSPQVQIFNVLWPIRTERTRIRSRGSTRRLFAIRRGVHHSAGLAVSYTPDWRLRAH